MKDTIKGMKRQATEWEKIFARHTPNKELFSKMYNILNSITFFFLIHILSRVIPGHQGVRGRLFPSHLEALPLDPEVNIVLLIDTSLFRASETSPGDV